jgi:hypothetical protein
MPLCSGGRREGCWHVGARHRSFAAWAGDRGVVKAHGLELLPNAAQLIPHRVIVALTAAASAAADVAGHGCPGRSATWARAQRGRHTRIRLRLTVARKGSSMLSRPRIWRMATLPRRPACVQCCVHRRVIVARCKRRRQGGGRRRRMLPPRHHKLFQRACCGQGEQRHVGGSGVGRWPTSSTCGDRVAEHGEHASVWIAELVAQRTRVHAVDVHGVASCRGCRLGRSPFLHQRRLDGYRNASACSAPPAVIARRHLTPVATV